MNATALIALAQAAGALCRLLAVSCPVAPGIEIIQSAYEREAAAQSKLHDKGLKVLKAKCHDRGDDRFLCEVEFTSRDDPEEPLYFDVVAVRRVGDRWELTSGLCKR